MGLLDYITGSNTKKLESKISKLEKQLEICNQKLIEKQEHIDRTNAYWKKKVFALRSQIDKN